jgi:hypothetical protein
MDGIFKTGIGAQPRNLPSRLKMTVIPIYQTHHLPTGPGVTLFQWPPPAVSHSDQQNSNYLFDEKD